MGEKNFFFEEKLDIIIILSYKNCKIKIKNIDVYQYWLLFSKTILSYYNNRILINLDIQNDVIIRANIHLLGSFAYDYSLKVKLYLLIYVFIHMSSI